MSKEDQRQGVIRNAQRYAFHPYPRANHEGGGPAIASSSSSYQRNVQPNLNLSRPYASQTDADPSGMQHHSAWQGHAQQSASSLRSPARTFADSESSREPPTSRSTRKSRHEHSSNLVGVAFKSKYAPNATVIIIGMKGVGKTTLGLIANRTLGRRFIDTDQLFRSSTNVSLEAYVSEHGWEAFRKRETAILGDVLARFPQDAIIACGGGVIESAEAREILRAARSTFPVVCILREDAAIRDYIDARWLDQYDEDLESMIRRRRPLYRSCSSHIFYNLTSSRVTIRDSMANSRSTGIHPLKFKQLGQSFVRLLQSILDLGVGADAHASQRWQQVQKRMPTGESSRSSISHLLASHGPGPGSETVASEKELQRQKFAVLPMRADVLSRSSLLSRRTTAMSMTFPDLAAIDASIFKTITQGVDAMEVRVDMLACMQPSTSQERVADPLKIPALDYEEVARQLETLRQAVPDVPILFTLRSDREGGFFHDDRKLSQRDTVSLHSQRIYFELLELAIALGVEMLDVELGWDPWMTKCLISGRGKTRIVPSYHDLAGALRWDSALPQQLYERACSFGNGVHVVMMIGTTQRSTIEQNSHLSAFSARSLSAAAADPRLRLPPLMALNMGLAGRSSRPFNDVLNFVSHPAMPVKAGRGQFSLKEMMEMLVRLSILQVSHFHLYGDIDNDAIMARRIIQAAFDEFGLPYILFNEGKWSLREYIQEHQRIDIPDRDDEAAKPNSISDGLFIVGQGRRQVALFAEMDTVSPTQLSLDSRIVQAVDIIAREDMALSLLGTERGRHIPNSLGEMRGPLVGCHTLPASIRRVLSANLAPINAPNMHRSGLLVVLEEHCESESDVIAEVQIAKRSALFALATMGFGTVYIIDEASRNSRSRELQSRRPSLSLPTSPRNSPAPLLDAWENDVLDLIKRSGPRAGEGDDEANASPIVNTYVKHIGLRALSQSVSVFSHTMQADDHPAATSAKGSSITFPEDETSEEDPQTASAINDFERHPSKKPCAVIIVGGTERHQEAVMRQLWVGTEASSRRSSPGTGGDGLDTPLPFVLPKELWDSFFGGTILRIPSKRSLPMGISSTPASGIGLLAGSNELPQSTDGVTVERNGWVNVSPWVVDRDRIERTVIESWTRRSAPIHFLQSIWQAHVPHS